MVETFCINPASDNEVIYDPKLKQAKHIKSGLTIRMV